MKKDIMEVVREFQNLSYLDWRLNTTFVTLIPKKEGEKTIFDYRPISLLSRVYKMIGKALAKRLSSVLMSLISDNQCGGVEGHQIHEGILVANELIDSRLKLGEPGLVYKLKFKKAFDTVSWRFMDALFHKFGFGLKWRNWLLTCWKLAKFSILVNGDPCGFFHSSRGLQQGDPLSPLIFSLVAESLGQLMLMAQRCQLVG